MPLARFQISVAADGLMPRDRIVNTLHLDAKDFDPLGGPNWDQLCQDLLDVWQVKWMGGVVANEIRVTAYRVGPAPQPPIATKVENLGNGAAIPGNRETALCLSYWNVRSNPRRRGRMFLPAAITGQSVNDPRPSAGLQTRALDLAAAIAGLGGVNVDWVVYSPTDGSSHPVVGAWVDNAWDVVRSRGLAPTARVERAVGA